MDCAVIEPGILPWEASVLSLELWCDTIIKSQASLKSLDLIGRSLILCINTEFTWSDLGIPQKCLSKDRLFPGKDTNRTPLECESQALPLKPRCSVRTLVETVTVAHLV